jgi:Icc-related predicted phosphoesterase
MSTFIYTTDLHGSLDMYEKLLGLAAKHKADFILIGGDISPLAPITVQRDFLENYLVPRLRDFKKEQDVEVFIMMGNDDFSVNMDVLEQAEEEGILKVMHMKVLKAGDRFIAGYSFISPTPFHIKDWERLEAEIKTDLNELAKKSDQRKTIWVFHVPPFKTKLDVLWNGEHAGSAAVKDFIDESQPLVTLHGHIHESPDMSGTWKEEFGETVSINPGNARFVIFDSELKSIELKE